MEVLHGKDKRSPQKIIQLEIQEDMRKGGKGSQSETVKTSSSFLSLRHRWKCVWHRGPWASLNKNTTYGLWMCWLEQAQHQQTLCPHWTTLLIVTATTWHAATAHPTHCFWIPEQLFTRNEPWLQNRLHIVVTARKSFSFSFYFELQGHKTLSCCSQAEHPSWQIQWGCYGYIPVKLWLLIATYWQFYGHSGAWEWTILFLEVEWFISSVNRQVTGWIRGRFYIISVTH